MAANEKENTEAEDCGGSDEDNGVQPTITYTSATDLSLDIVDPVSIDIQGLSVSVESAGSFFGGLLHKRARYALGTEHKVILSQIYARISAGSLTCLLGGSGR